MSKKTFLPQEWENAPSNHVVTTPMHPASTYNNVEEDVERIVHEIEKQGIDIAPDYKQWVDLGFALADGLGEMGRNYYHRISQLHPNYNYTNTDKQYTNCLNGKGHGITIKSFFHLAMNSGITVSKQDFTILPNNQNGKTAKWKNEETDLPVLPDEVFDNLPPFLAKIVDNALSKEDRDTILLGSIACLSACFYNVCGVYDERIVYANLYLYVIADAGMGKGSLSLCRELVTPINQKLHELTKEAEKQYKEAIAYNKNKKSEGPNPSEPPMRMFIIPANSSASSLLKILADNDGIGLLFETEGDTLSQTLKSDYGNYSDTLRKAYHHETISLSRRKDREYLEVKNPRLSVVLAGTPEQVRRLIPDTENGLMSRFIFNMLPYKRYIRNVFATDDISKSKNVIFRNLGEELYHYQAEFIQSGNYSFSLPSHLQTDFVEHLIQLNNKYCDEVDDRIQGVIRRMGLIAFRMMMLLTTLRRLNHLPTIRAPDDTFPLVCQEVDYQTVMTICDTIIEHSVYWYKKLTPYFGVNRESESLKRSERFFDLLPDTFNKNTFDSLVEQYNENPNTAIKWIDKYIKKGKLNRISQGHYEKIERK